MDFQFYQYNGQQNRRRSEKMELASLVLGTAACTTSCLIYPSLVCGSLAIMFALLSRGREMTLTPRAKTGLVLGIAGLAIFAFLLIYLFFAANIYYGGLEEMLRETCNMMGYDYDTLFSFH